MSKTIDRCISVIGLGYVGLPVAISFGKKTKVIGYDINENRINNLKDGLDTTGEISASDLAVSKVHFTSNSDEISKADFHIITVPTPVDKNKKPDLELLLLASKTIGKILKKGDIVVYESTVYPGVTEHECAPVLEGESKLKCGEDFFLGYSPERINPGDKEHSFETIVKVVSAQNDEALEIIANVYSSVVNTRIYKAPSIKVAEAAKVIENTQRDLNIALINELAILFKYMNIDTHDVLKTASTKWNFLPFEPGLVGGHCIGIDPYYLTYQSSLLGYSPEVILAGRSINDNMGEYIANIIINELKNNDKELNNAIITILGITFKENISDIRNSKVVDIHTALLNQSVKVQIYDPHVKNNDLRNEYNIDLSEFSDLKKSDAVILAVPHEKFVKEGWSLILKLLKSEDGIVYDVKSILSRDKKPEKINLMRL
jgi:UDP-N-acetyl-D-galactosamine dehydrogenase